MAIARYFSKDALAISQLLNRGSVEEFEKILNFLLETVKVNLFKFNKISNFKLF